MKHHSWPKRHSNVAALFFIRIGGEKIESDWITLQKPEILPAYGVPHDSMPKTTRFVACLIDTQNFKRYGQTMSSKFYISI
jgi:hypothetical protein